MTQIGDKIKQIVTPIKLSKLRRDKYIVHWWGFFCSIIGFLYCVLCTVACFIYLLLSHGVVSIFLTYEF